LLLVIHQLNLKHTYTYKLYILEAVCFEPSTINLRRELIPLFFSLSLLMSALSLGMILLLFNLLKIKSCFYPMFRYPTYRGQGFGILFRSVIFSVLSFLIISALLRGLQKMAASKSIF
jgi:hypothetical protein